MKFTSSLLVNIFICSSTYFLYRVCKSILQFKCIFVTFVSLSGKDFLFELISLMDAILFKCISTLKKKSI